MLFDPSITTSEMAQKTGVKFCAIQGIRSNISMCFSVYIIFSNTVMQSSASTYNYAAKIRRNGRTAKRFARFLVLRLYTTDKYGTGRGGITLLRPSHNCGPDEKAPCLPYMYPLIRGYQSKDVLCVSLPTSRLEQYMSFSFRFPFYDYTSISTLLHLLSSYVELHTILVDGNLTILQVCAILLSSLGSSLNALYSSFVTEGHTKSASR